MILEEKKKIFYNTYKKLSKGWSYKCDVFVFDAPKFFSNLFSGDEMTFDSLWVEYRESGYARVWFVCVSSSGVVFGQLTLQNNELNAKVLYTDESGSGSTYNITTMKVLEREEYVNQISEVYNTLEREKGFGEYKWNL